MLLAGCKAPPDGADNKKQRLFLKLAHRLWSPLQQRLYPQQ